MNKLVEIKNLKKYFWTGGGPFKKKDAVRAIDDVSLYNYALTEEEIQLQYNLGNSTDG